MRLRIFDLNCRFFWFVVFYYSDTSPNKGHHFEANLYKSQSWSKGWLNVWKWEPRIPPIPAALGEAHVDGWAQEHKEDQ